MPKWDSLPTLLIFLVASLCPTAIGLGLHHPLGCIILVPWHTRDLLHQAIFCSQAMMLLSLSTSLHSATTASRPPPWEQAVSPTPSPGSGASGQTLHLGRHSHFGERSLPSRPHSMRVTSQTASRWSTAPRPPTPAAHRLAPGWPSPPSRGLFLGRGQGRSRKSRRVWPGRAAHGEARAWGPHVTRGRAPWLWLRWLVVFK